MNHPFLDRWRSRLPLFLWLSAGTYFVLCIIAVIIAAFRPVQAVTNHYVFQAVSWLHGSLALDNAPQGITDVVRVNGHTYLPLGPLPALFVLPGVALFSDDFPQFAVMIILASLSVWLAWRITGQLHVTHRSTRLWLVVLFFLSTVYFYIFSEGWSWHLAHVVTCFFLFLAINEALGRRRALLLGLYIGLAAASRLTAAFTFPFCLLLLALDCPDPVEATQWRFVALPTLIKRWFVFGVAAAVPLSLTLVDNALRFGNPLDTGYANALLGGRGLLEPALAVGLFSLQHIPKNIYYFLLAMPEPLGKSPTGNPADSPVLTFPFLKPSVWGMSIFLTTPAIIYVVKAGFRRPIVQACWAAIVLTAIPILTYYGIGYKQFGYRYALDFIPFLWILIVLALRERHLTIKKPTLALWLIVLGMGVNLWGVLWFTEIFVK